MIKRKKEEGRERFKRGVEKAVRERKEWEVINGERKKWKEVSRDIKIEEWADYLRNLSGGMDKRVRGEGMVKR